MSSTGGPNPSTKDAKDLAGSVSQVRRHGTRASQPLLGVILCMCVSAYPSAHQLELPGS